MAGYDWGCSWNGVMQGWYKIQEGIRISGKGINRKERKGKERRQGRAGRSTRKILGEVAGREAIDRPKVFWGAAFGITCGSWRATAGGAAAAGGTYVPGKFCVACH